MNDDFEPALDDSDRTFFEQAAANASEATGHAVQYATHHRHNDALVAARFRLENDLTIILMPDKRAPVFAYQTWFRVGSRHEDPTRTGMAHLLEHLMFKATKNHPAGELDREMERRGAETNAATWVDWTYYTAALAARDDNLETLVDFEADRMTALILDEETFGSELEVVKNERRMAVEDSITGLLSERLYALSFEKHPYRSPTIGAMAHLEEMRLEDLESFYKTYYAPNNATVVLVGAIDPGETLTLIARRYGSLSAQAIPTTDEISEPRQEAARFETLERQVVASQLLIGFRAPAQSHADYAAVEMLGEALIVGDNARLHRRLITVEKVATEVVGFLTPFADPGLYELAITLRPDVSPEHAIDLVQAELDLLAEHGLEDHELDKTRNGLELSLLDGLAQAESCAEALGHFETNHGDFSHAFRGRKQWAEVSNADLCAVAAKVFRSSSRTAILAKAPEA